MDNNVRIAVTGTGGGVGQSIIKALQDTEYGIVALDGEPLAVGLYAAPTSYVIPYASDPSFIEKTLAICQKEGVKLLFPGLDAELPYLSKAAGRFKAAGITVVVSPPEVVELSDNKMLTYTTLTQHGIAVPRTVDMASPQADMELPAYPFILKPKTGGHRSRGVNLIQNENQLKSLGQDLSQYVAQEHIEGDEYTCGSIVLDGECKGVIVMRRTLRDGDTYQAFAVKNRPIEDEVRKVVAAIKPFGPCNIQLRVKDGTVYVLEINARCSGTTAARALCGFNEPKMVADFLILNKEPAYEIKEQTVLRYWKELVVVNETVEQIQQDGSLTRSDFTKL